MKKFCTMLLGLTAVCCLTVGACADAIADPVRAAIPGGWGTMTAVIAVVVVTMILIRRNGKEK